VGDKDIIFRIVGKNPASSGYRLGLDAVKQTQAISRALVAEPRA